MPYVKKDQNWVTLYKQKGRSDVWKYERYIDGKRYKYCYAVNKYGKHAKLMAEYSAKHHVKLQNWFEEKDDHIIIWSYYKKEDSYKQILIDKEDYDKIKDYYWGIRQNEAGNYYAQTNKGNAKTKMEVIWMHRLINNTPDNLIVDHINRNGLDNRKANLNNCDYYTNNSNFDKNSNNSTGYRGIYSDKYAYIVEWNDKDTHKTHSVRIKFSDFDTKEEALNEAVYVRNKMTELNNYAVDRYNKFND